MARDITRIDKKNQIDKVLNLITLPIKTEKDRKNLLYNLAYLNNMVKKGYMVQHTKMDERIYKVKDLALDFIVKQMPERCFLSIDNRYYVIYIYVNGRQYSFHTTNTHGLDFNYKRNLPVVRWDGLKDGWKLSDTAYKRKKEILNRTRAAEKAKVIAKRKNWELRIQKAVIRQIHLLQRNRDRVEEFERVMEEKITPAQRRTKTYKEYQRCKTFDWENCWKLWGEKWGFSRIPPETYFIAWSCADSEKGRDYAKSFFEKVKSHYNL